MILEWTGRRTVDAESNATVLQAKVNGHSVSVYVSQEAMEDVDMVRIRGLAEAKIVAATQNGEPPSRVEVRLGDLGAK